MTVFITLLGHGKTAWLGSLLAACLPDCWQGLHWPQVWELKFNWAGGGRGCHTLNFISLNPNSVRPHFWPKSQRWWRVSFAQSITPGKKSGTGLD